MSGSETRTFSDAFRIVQCAAQRLLSVLEGSRPERQRYRVGRRFHKAIRQHLSGLERYPMYPVWSEFALSTNLRGKEVARKLQPYTEIRGKRCLDVGCAYGGYPIAFAAEGAEAVGIDINGGFLELAAENMKDQRASVVFLERDVTRFDQVCDLGLFDIITCNDLIEHVEDVPTTFSNIASLLRPGALLFMQIPNAWSVGQVLKDGHYGLFGITLLPRPDAIRYFRENGYNDEYSVGHFHRLEEYLAFLQNNKIQLQDADMAAGQEPLDGQLQRVRDALPTIRATLQTHLTREELSSKTRDALSVAVESFLREVSDRLHAYDAASGPILRRLVGSSVVKSYEIEFWDLIGLKEAGSSS